MEEKRLVGRIARITIFPVKSMRGVDVEEGDCQYTGLKAGGICDRRFMVADHWNELVTARTVPRMALIVSKIEDGVLHLDIPGVEPLVMPIPKTKEGHKIVKANVWGDTVETIDCGPEVAEWLDKVLGGHGLHLVYHFGDMRKRQLNTYDSEWHRKCRPQDQVAFHDGFPFLMLSKESVADLNTRTSEPISINNFRPTFIVEGCGAYEEDTWENLYIGDTVLHNIKPCHRCIMTTINPQVGKRSAKFEPLRTMRKYRMLPDTEPPFWMNSPVFAINLIALQPGKVHVGDPIYATFKKK